MALLFPRISADKLSMMKLRVFLAMMGLALSACDRLSQDGPAKLILQTPEASSVSQKLSAQGGNISDPTSLSEINCYGITITGPTDEMRRNNCGLRGISSSRFAVGKWLMMVPAGSEISMDVPAGKDREIRLIGMKAAPGKCLNLGSEAARTADFSRPYVIGSVSGLEMKAGATMEVSIPMSFDADKAFDDCVGPDFTSGVFDPNRPREDGPDNGTVIPTRVKLTNAEFPPWRFRENSCIWVSVGLENDRGNSGILPSPVTAQIQINGTNTPIYSNQMDCYSSYNSTSVVTIPAESFHAGVVVKIPPASAHPTVGLTLTNVSAPIPLTAIGITAMPNGPDSGLTFRIGTLDRVLPGVCYRGDVTSVMVGGYETSAEGTVTMGSTASGVSFYSDAACASAQSSFTLAPSGGGFGPARAIFYYKVAPGADTTITASKADFETAKQRVVAGAGTNTISFVDLRLYTSTHTHTCIPMGQMLLFNNDGTSVPAPAAGATANLTGLPAGGLYGSAECTEDAALGSSVTMNPYASQRIFYAKFTQAGHFNVTVSSTLMNHSYTRNITVNGPHRLSLELVEPGTKNPGQCVEVQATALNLDGTIANIHMEYPITLQSGQIYATRSSGECTDPVAAIPAKYPQTTTSFYVRVDNTTTAIATQTLTALAPSLQSGTVSMSVNPRMTLTGLWHPTEPHFGPAEYPLKLEMVPAPFSGRPAFIYTQTSGPGSISGSTFNPLGAVGVSAFNITDAAETVLPFSMTTVATSNAVSFTSGTLPAGIILSRGSTGSYYNATGDLAYAAAEIPRFDHNPNPSSSFAARGLLIEPAATNFVRHANFDLSTWTAPSNQVLVESSLPSVTSPDGSNTTLGLANNPVDPYNMPYISTQMPSGPVAGQRYTASVYLKKDSARFTGIKLHEDGYPNYGHAGVVMDLDTGNFVAMSDPWSSDQSISYGVQRLKNGWYRLWVSYVAKGGNYLSLYIYPSYHMGSTLSPTREFSATGRNYFWGPQIENVAAMTSYIPTSGAPATRQADVVNGALATAFPAFTGVQDSFRIHYETAPSRLPNVTPSSIMVICGASCSSDRIKLSLDEQQRVEWSGVSGGTSHEPLLGGPGLRGSVVATTFGVKQTGFSRVVLGHSSFASSSGASDTWNGGSFSGGTIHLGNSPGLDAGTPMHIRRLEHWPSRFSTPVVRSISGPM